MPYAMVLYRLHCIGHRRKDLGIVVDPGSPFLICAQGTATSERASNGQLPDGPANSHAVRRRPNPFRGVPTRQGIMLLDIGAEAVLELLEEAKLPRASEDAILD